MNEIIHSQFDLSPSNDEDIRRLVSSVLAGLNPHTQRAYAVDHEEFVKFINIKAQSDESITQISGIPEAAKLLLSRGHGRANLLVIDYVNYLKSLKDNPTLGTKKLAPNTINRRLAAVKSIVKFARKIGMVPWVIEVDMLKVETYKDTAGPGLDGFVAMLDAAELQKNEKKAARDVAIMWICGCDALRRAEVYGLDIGHFDLRNSRVSILGKRRTEREWITIAPQVVQAIENWLVHRGREPGPLFPSMNRANGEKILPMSEEGFYKLIVKIGSLAGITVHPHALRHFSIDAAAKLKKDDPMAVQEFGRHKDFKTTQKYIHRAEDSHGKIGSLIATMISERRKKAGDSGDK